MGRPQKTGSGLAAQKMTSEVRDTLLLALRCGAPIEAAIAFAGVARQTLYGWLRQGAIDRTDHRINTRYAVFHRQYEEAIGACEVRLAKLVSEAAQNDWKAAITLLERKWPERWARRTVVQVGGPRDAELLQPQDLDLDKLTDAELDVFSNMLEKASK